jgi:hypothetical protein
MGFARMTMEEMRISDCGLRNSGQSQPQCGQGDTRLRKAYVAASSMLLRKHTAWARQSVATAAVPQMTRLQDTVGGRTVSLLPAGCFGPPSPYFLNTRSSAISNLGKFGVINVMSALLVITGSDSCSSKRYTRTVRGAVHPCPSFTTLLVVCRLFFTVVDLSSVPAISLAIRTSGRTAASFFRRNVGGEIGYQIR